jgi:glycosyltransferase involved in cell wall biosynthesis
MVSKLSKFRISPEQFFADSRHPALRAAGRLVGPRVLRRELVRELLEDPVEGLANARLWGLSALPSRARRLAATGRREGLVRAGEPLVSIIVAAHRAARTIERALASLLGQTYPHVEVVVVDDASDDDTAAIVEAVAAREPRVTLLRTGSQRGPAAARNLGLARARGAYLTFQDADDVSHPERIERQLAALIGRPEAVMCVCNYRRETPDGRRVTINGKRFARGAITMLVAREPVLSRLGYMLDIPLGEDGEYAERVRAVFGEGSEVYLFQTLYRAGFSPESLLFSSGETRLEGDRRVRYVRSERVERQIAEVRDRLERIRAGELDPYIGL